MGLTNISCLFCFSTIYVDLLKREKVRVPGIEKDTRSLRSHHPQKRQTKILHLMYHNLYLANHDAIESDMTKVSVAKMTNKNCGIKLKMPTLTKILKSELK